VQELLAVRIECDLACEHESHVGGQLVAELGRAVNVVATAQSPGDARGGTGNGSSRRLRRRTTRARRGGTVGMHDARRVGAARVV
jgi:hypothetical protein